MKRITLQDIITALKDNRHQITVPEETRRRALQAVERMLAVPGIKVPSEADTIKKLALNSLEALARFLLIHSVKYRRKG